MHSSANPGIGSPQLQPQEPLPDHVDLRPELHGIQDQGERGTCLAFAVTACHEHVRLPETSVVADLSEEVLYWGAKQIDDDYDPGTSFASVAAALKNRGQPEEAAWPYDSLRSDTDASYQPPTGATAPEICFRALLEPSGTAVFILKQQLAAGKAIPIGLQLWSGFFDADNGQIASPGEQEEMLDGHAVLLVGYADYPDGGSDSAARGYFVLHNSWGTEWGDAGHGYLPYHYFEDHPVLAYILDKG